MLPSVSYIDAAVLVWKKWTEPDSCDILPGRSPCDAEQDGVPRIAHMKYYHGCSLSSRSFVHRRCRGAANSGLCSMVELSPLIRRSVEGTSMSATKELGVEVTIQTQMKRWYAHGLRFRDCR